MVLEKQKLLHDDDYSDMISDLPNHILHHILSLLPTRIAASTCVLSKRWMQLWTSIHVLDFRCWLAHIPLEQRPLHVIRFVNFVDRTVFFNDISNIQKFYLDCEGLSRYFFKIETWISIVLMHKVKELIIQNPLNDLLNCCLVTSELLTRLELTNAKDFNLPESVYFPRLKILKLLGLLWTDSDICQRLFSNFRTLEELIMKGCKWNNEITISTPTLKHLLCWKNCLIQISAPNLVYLSYRGSPTHINVICNSSSLVHANIYIFPYKDLFTSREKVTAIKLLGQLSNVKHLSLFYCTPKDFCLSDASTNLPTFYNLAHLKVNPELLCSTNKSLLNLLRKLPKLESLVFQKAFPPYLSNGDGGESTVDTMRHALLLNLKSVEFHSFEGHKRDMCVVNFFLKNATVLQTMTIYKKINGTYKYVLSGKMSEVEVLKGSMEVMESEMKIMKEKMKVMEEILGFPRASTSCVIKIK